jgi:hypothetical protein
MFAVEVLAMPKQQLLVWTMSLVAASFALRERATLDAAVETFSATFPDDAALLVVDTVGEVVEAES